MVVPSTVVGTPLTVNTALPEFKALTCAWLPTTTGEFSVVRSMTRKRIRVKLVSVLFVIERRMVSVPAAEFGPTAPALVSRSRLGETDEVFVVSSRLVANCELRLAGEVRFSGPGAPSCETLALKVPPVAEVKLKSAWLLFVSCGSPPEASGERRTKLYSPMAAMPPGGGSDEPYVKRVVLVESWEAAELKGGLLSKFAVLVVLT